LWRVRPIWFAAALHLMDFGECSFKQKRDFGSFLSRVENAFAEMLLSFACSGNADSFNFKKAQILKNPSLHALNYLRYDFYNSIIHTFK
jgi:hypothetical protein